jgi:hypothetical protein
MADLSANQIPVYAVTPLTGVGVIAASSNTVTLGSNTNAATIVTAGASGARVYSLMASTDDTVTVNVFLFIYNGTTVQPLGLVNVPLSSGNTNAARFPVDFLNPSNLPGLPLDNTAKPYIELGPNDVLKCGALANLTAAKTCWVTAQGAQYA